MENWLQIDKGFELSAEYVWIDGFELRFVNSC